MPNQEYYRQQLIDLISGEVQSLENDPRFSEIHDMWQNYAEAFCCAPGSHKLSYHHCWPGGLATHALSVTKLARKFAAIVGYDQSDSLTLVCLFHDLGKAAGYYVSLDPNNSRWQQGERYKYTKEWHASHAQRSLWMLQRHNVVLSSEEYRAILLHDGQYVEANRRFGMNEPDLAYILHWADLWDARHAETNPFEET